MIKGQSDGLSPLQQLGQMLVGSWRLFGDASGSIQYEWAEGGFFLIQHVDIVVLDRPIKGIEIIGHMHRAGEEPSAEIFSRFYSFGDGLTLDYVYEPNGGTFTIWFKYKGSDNRFVGIFSDDLCSYEGAWTWPGGGYKVTANKVSL